MKIALISCGKMKQNYRCEARELYAPSQLFTLSYQYAKRYADQIYILSAKYGLLSKTDVIEPYDLTLTDLPLKRQQAWANYVLTQLKAKCDPEVHDPYLQAWTLNTSKNPSPGLVNKEKEHKVEQKVSLYMRESMTFAVFPMKKEQQRLRMEEAIIASLNQSSDFGPSNTWLGRFSPEPEICQSGLWLKQGLISELPRSVSIFFKNFITLKRWVKQAAY